MPIRAPGSTGARSTIAVLALAVVLATVAVAVVPGPLASLWPGGGYASADDVGRALAPALVRFWRSGSGVVSPDLAAPVAYWARFHLVKALLAVALLASTVLLGRRLGRALAVGRVALVRVGIAAGAAASVPLAIVALLMVVANIQGLVAPLSSTLSLLPTDGSDPALVAAVDQLRRAAAHAAPSPPAQTLLHDFAMYHAVLTVIAAVVTVGLLATLATAWSRGRRGATAERGVRRGRAGLMAVTAATALFFGVVTAANAGTAADPAPALVAFFDGTGA